MKTEFIELIKKLIISARPNTWLRIWGEMIVAAVLSASPGEFNFHSFLTVFLITSPLLWSAAYILNDLTDIQLDKHHNYRKSRPIARGTLSPTTARYLVLVLTGTAFSAAWMISISTGILISLLILSQVAYTVPPLRLKTKPVFDIGLNAVNSALRFCLGWVSQTGNSLFPTGLLLMFVIIKIALFLGHRLQNRQLEIKAGIKSTTTLLSEKLSGLLIGSSLLTGLLLYFTSMQTGTLPWVSLYAGIFFLPVFITVWKDRTTRLFSEETSISFRSLLYFCFFLWSNAVAVSVLLYI